MKFSKLYFTEAEEPSIDINDTKVLLTYLRQEYQDVLEREVYDANTDEIDMDRFVDDVWEIYINDDIKGADLSPILKAYDDKDDSVHNQVVDQLNSFMEKYKDVITTIIDKSGEDITDEYWEKIANEVSAEKKDSELLRRDPERYHGLK